MSFKRKGVPRGFRPPTTDLVVGVPRGFRPPTTDLVVGVAAVMVGDSICIIYNLDYIILIIYIIPLCP
jgi:hypothetical protein